MAPPPAKSGRERRQHERLRLSLPLKYLGDDLVEHEGMLFDISAGGLALSSDERPPIGAHIAAYVSNLGRVEGRVVRYLDQGFAIEFTASEAKRTRLAGRLAWLANEREPAPESVRATGNADARFVMGDGREVACRVLDMSMHGVRLQVNVKPPLGEEVAIGKMRGRVCQHHSTGIAIEFLPAAPTLSTRPPA